MQLENSEIIVRIATQTMELIDADGSVIAHYPVSTAANGTGNEEGSYRTPTGNLEIYQKIGDGSPPGMIFRERVPTGEIGTEQTPGDCVQTRILWLAGMDPENANTRDRYIYIHGTNHESQIGIPCSMGCIRMRNTDIVALYDRVPVGTTVRIFP